MNQFEHDKKIVDELRKVMQKHHSIGAIRMVECLRFAFEKEIGYAVHGTRPKRSPKTGARSGRKIACPTD
jgi:hypothetical protein